MSTLFVCGCYSYENKFVKCKFCKTNKRKRSECTKEKHWIHDTKHFFLNLKYVNDIYFLIDELEKNKEIILNKEILINNLKNKICEIQKEIDLLKQEIM